MEKIVLSKKDGDYICDKHRTWASKCSCPVGTAWNDWCLQMKDHFGVDPELDGVNWDVELQKLVEGD